MKTIEHLRTALAHDLPGHDGFLAHAGYKRADLDRSLRGDPTPRESAVLVLLFEREGELRTQLMVRPDYDGVHGGQVSFPGGKKEPDDRDHWATAEREFAEETGIVLNGIERIGVLSRVYIPPSRMLVTPCVAYAPTIGPSAPDPAEVAELFEAPLASLLAHDAVKHREQYIHIAGGSTTVPFFDLGGRVVWGATAMMLWELREVMRSMGA